MKNFTILRKQNIKESFTPFDNIPHRLEPPILVNGIEFINDSKSTNINSTWYALENMTKPVVLILGGIDKYSDYSVIKQLVKEKVKAIICLGKDNKKIISAFSGVIGTILETQSIKQCIEFAYRMAKKGDAVLLSPGAASFDLFYDYQDRGEQFKASVRAL